MRMPGRYQRGGCWSGTRSNGKRCVKPGPDCSGHERDTRWRKRVEQREVAAEIRELSFVRDDDDDLLFVAEVPEILGSGWLHVPPSYCGFVAYLCTQLLEGGLPDEVTDEQMEMLSLILEAAQQAAKQATKP